MSMIDVEMRVVVRGQVSLARTSARSVVNLERKFGCGALDLFIGESPRMEALYWLAWESLNVAGQPVGAGDTGFDLWLDGLEVFEVDPGALAPPPPPPP